MRESVDLAKSLIGFRRLIERRFPTHTMHLSPVRRTLDLSTHVGAGKGIVDLLAIAGIFEYSNTIKYRATQRRVR